MDKYYSAFGLCIKSNFEITELLEIADQQKADVEILKEQTLSRRATKKHGFYGLTDEGFSFDVPKVAIYDIKDGSKICITPYNGSSDASINLYLLGTAFGTLLYQRGLVPLHGSALICKGKGILITGDSGAGKSTLAHALDSLGCPILTDDVAAIKMVDKVPLIFPSYPSHKLSEDSANWMGLKVMDKKRIREEKQKYYFPIDHLYHEHFPLDIIILLTKKYCRAVSIKELFGSEKLSVILNSCYRKEVIESLGFKGHQLLGSAEIYEKTRVYCLNRPQRGFSIDEQVEMIQALTG